MTLNSAETELHKTQLKTTAATNYRRGAIEGAAIAKLMLEKGWNHTRTFEEELLFRLKLMA